MGAEVPPSGDAEVTRDTLARIVRFFRDGRGGYGLLKGDLVFELSGEISGEFEEGPYIAECDELKLLTPCLPGKIVGVGLNYRRLIEECGAAMPEIPNLFLKPPSAVIGPADRIVLPRTSNEVVFEAELAVVVKRQAKHVPPSAVPAHVLGYTCANDVSARDFPRQDARTKSFDTFCPLGPYVATGLDPSDLMIRSRVNGRLQQEASTREMVFSVSDLVSLISQVMTLQPGDVILTGTPPGAGTLKMGDVVEVEIEGIGTLVNEVVADR
jgi:2-keto-4-pentenoate hydratase/2-oxohepta-3-ene-1,7-dioic acid hydratase in catechol pathway